MISKELFCEIIRNIRRQEFMDKMFENVLSERTKSYVVFDPENLYLKSLVMLLKDLFKDDADIEFYLWGNCDFKITCDNGTVRTIESPEELYDYLIEKL